MSTGHPLDRLDAAAYALPDDVAARTMSPALVVHLDREGYLPLSKDDVTLRFPFRAVVEVKMEPAPGQAGLPAARPAVNREGSREAHGIEGRILGLEPIPDFAHGLNEAGTAGIVLDLAAQRIHATVDAAPGHHHIVAPDVVQQLFAGERAPFLVRQVGEEGVLFGG